MMQIIGATGIITNVEDVLKKISAFSLQHHVTVQIMDADVVYGKPHLESAIEHAIRAFTYQTQTTNSLAKEILLYASGERQITLAIKKMGVTIKTKRVALVFVYGLKKVTEAKGTIKENQLKQFLDDVGFHREDKVLEGDTDTLQRFGISLKEIATVPPEKYGHLILEKIAMVDIIK